MGTTKVSAVEPLERLNVKPERVLQIIIDVVAAEV
jgi:hypothetical protein